MPQKLDQREYRKLGMLLPGMLPEQRKINSEYYVEGYATTFDSPYEMDEWDGIKYYERVDKHALDSADMSDVIMQYDHAGRVLARQANGTLGLEVRDDGLFIYADLSKSRAAQDMYEEIAGGLINKMSWAFRVSEDAYDRDTRTRTILKISKVYDVSAVSYPANGDTEISARSYFGGLIEGEQRESLEKRRRILNLKLLTEGIQ